MSSSPARRPARRAAPPPRRCRRRVALLAGAALLLPIGDVAGEVDGSSGAAAGAGPAAVEPVDEWLRMIDVVWREERIGLHLRTGYARPLVLPEAVRLASIEPLPGAGISIDDELVVFEPSAHFDARPVDLVGLESERVYRFRVRSSTLGKRVPLRVVLP